MAQSQPNPKNTNSAAASGAAWMGTVTLLLALLLSLGLAAGFTYLSYRHADVAPTLVPALPAALPADPAAPSPTPTEMMQDWLSSNTAAVLSVGGAALLILLLLFWIGQGALRSTDMPEVRTTAKQFSSAFTFIAFATGIASSMRLTLWSDTPALDYVLFLFIVLLNAALALVLVFAARDDAFCRASSFAFIINFVVMLVLIFASRFGINAQFLGNFVYLVLFLLILAAYQYIASVVGALYKK